MKMVVEDDGDEFNGYLRSGVLCEHCDEMEDSHAPGGKCLFAATSYVAGQRIEVVFSLTGQAPVSEIVTTPLNNTNNTDKP